MRSYPTLPVCGRKLLFHKQGKVETNIGERMCVTDEEGDLLYALVRMAKPLFALETGTYLGDSALRIASAIIDNGIGWLMTCEIECSRVEHCRRVLAGLPVEVLEQTGASLIQSYGPDSVGFAFVDSGPPDVRLEELRLLVEHEVIRSGGVLAIHDICVDYPQLYDYMGTLDWPHIIFDSQVGIGVFQRP